ncbi:MAG: hypothetical protein FJ008_01975 [Chloroflexi bacterium]|nr:hypothetical protein [Chloroflexota bacterium]MBM3154083.1 hypothetical protein [Chloroflexota bacterium]MBM3172538.1 hypothetical protein [Chloroflexota bacterium]MBM4450914.1 hypothetical protein [Chloroflexota bacterium]
MVTSVFPNIGLGLLVLGVRLMLVRNALRRAGIVPEEIAKKVKREGKILFIVGAVVIVIGCIFYRLLSKPETMAIVNAGAILAPLGLAQLIQGVVLKQQGSGRQRGEMRVCIWAYIVTVTGAAIVLAYAFGVYTQSCLTG